MNALTISAGVGLALHAVFVGYLAYEFGNAVLTYEKWPRRLWYIVVAVVWAGLFVLARTFTIGWEAL